MTLRELSWIGRELGLAAAHQAAQGRQSPSPFSVPQPKAHLVTEGLLQSLLITPWSFAS